MIVVDPCATPYTIPVVDPTVPIVVLLLDHVPPAGVEFNVVVESTHTRLVPVMPVGCVFTVTFVVVIQPVAITS